MGILCWSGWVRELFFGVSGGAQVRPPRAKCRVNVLFDPEEQVGHFGTHLKTNYIGRRPCPQPHRRNISISKVSFPKNSIVQGELISFMGPRGEGKATLLQMLAQVFFPDTPSSLFVPSHLKVLFLAFLGSFDERSTPHHSFGIALCAHDLGPLMVIESNQWQSLSHYRAITSY